jgi:1-acyl-sn-glycerol-3-phosphate acyltransferase
MKNIEDWSFRYAFLRPLIRGIFRFAFRKIEVEGLDNIPADKPVILAPNHQNALTDALAIVYSYPPQPVFLARADIFKKKIVIAALTFLKIMPVFRIRDGFDSLAKNDKTFDACIRLLKKKKTLSLFPEAAHNGQKSMLPHKKAIPRIVFLAGEQTNFNLDLYIVPVGINYTHYYKFRSDLVIRYGKPIAVKEYYDIYRNDSEIAATNALRDRIYVELEKVCVNVPNKDLYDVYIQLFEIFKRDVCSKQNKKPTTLNLFKSEQYLISKLSPFFNDNPLLKVDIADAAVQYGQLKYKFKLNEASIQKGEIRSGEIILSSLLFLLLIPFAIPGLILYGWLYYVTNYSFRGFIKDNHFYSSFSYALTLFLLPVWLMILLVIGFMITKKWIIAAISVVISVPCAIIAWEMVQQILEVKNRLRYTRLLRLNNDSFVSMLEKREFITSNINNGIFA